MDERAVTLRAQRVWLDDERIVHVESIKGVEQTLADAQEAVAVVRALAGQRRLPVLVDLRQGAGLDRAARSYYASPETAAVEAAAALLIGSPLSRMMGNFFINLSKPSMPTRLFTSEPEAIAWLRSFLE